MKQYTLSSRYLARTFEISDNGIRTISLRDLDRNRELVHAPVREYAFSADDVGFSSWSEVHVHEVDGNLTGGSLAPRLKSVCEKENSLAFTMEQGPFDLILRYDLLAEASGMRKSVVFKNRSSQKVMLSSLVFDDTCVCPGAFSDCDFYAGTGDAPQSVTFTLAGTEDIIRCHNSKLNEGWLMGSSAPGVLHYFMVYPHWGNVINGCNMSSAPFVRILQPGESFSSPESLLAIYHGALDDSRTETAFRSLIRQTLPALKVNEQVMYCSWLPFLKNINFELCCDLAERAAKFGFGYFVLDDGWFTDNDREVDRAKFPGGLAPLAEHVRKLGLTFGLWLNVGTDYGMKRVPEEWYARRYDGKVNRLGFDYSTAGNVLCFGSCYRDYVIKKLQALADEFGIGYFKLDFSSVASPYGILPWGCHATDHKFHQGWEDSFGAIYEGMFAVRDALAASHPEVIVDFSFEAFGNERPSIGALQLSRIHHATNTSALNPEILDITRARRNFYRWLGKLPPERILNGLLSLGSGRAIEYLLTSFAGAPLVSGDLRKIPGELEEQIKACTAAFNQAVAPGALTEFQVLAEDADFDAFCRCRPDGHGIICAFNHSKRDREVASLAGGQPLKPVMDDSLVLASGTCGMYLI